MELTFLKASNGLPFAKHIKRTEDSYEVTPYPNVFRVTSHAVDCQNIEHLRDIIEVFGKENWALLKGNLKKQLKNESRRGSHDPAEPTQLIVLDIDKYYGTTDPEKFLAKMPSYFHNVSYVFQPSASFGLTDELILSGHIFMWLSAPALPHHLKAWLIKLNLELAFLNEQLELDAGNQTLRYKLDITTCQNDKLIFIAPPICENFNDPVTDRYQFVEKETDILQLDLRGINPETIRRDKNNRIQLLREAKGLPKASMRTRQIGNRSVVSNPDGTQVTDIREEENFIRLNLNGGDSWAYWHPKGNHELIYSFKDDEVYLAKELVPAYYEEREEKRKYLEQKRKEERIALAAGGVFETGIENPPYIVVFRDIESGGYYCGKYYPDKNFLKTYLIQRNAIKDWFMQYNTEMPEFIPSYYYQFIPHRDVLLDTKNEFINRYSKPKIYNKIEESTVVPSTIHEVLHHALGNDDETYWHFINWLAYIVQNMTSPRTAWVWHGTQGTGKGLFFHHVLRRIIGERYCSIKRLHDFGNRFTSVDPNKLLVLVDESNLDALDRNTHVSESIKTAVTEPMVTYEQKGLQPVDVPNHASYIFTSNDIRPLTIARHDRRINVAKRQDKKFEYREGMIDALKEECGAFLGFLLQYKVNTHKASQPLMNRDREELILRGTNSQDEIIQRFMSGDFEWMLHELPNRVPVDWTEKEEYAKAIETLRLAVEMADENEGEVRFSPRELRDLFVAFDDKIPEKNKFNSMMRKCGLERQQLRCAMFHPRFEGERERVYVSTFTISEEDKKELLRRVQELKNPSKSLTVVDNS